MICTAAIEPAVAASIATPASKNLHNLRFGRGGHVKLFAHEGLCGVYPCRSQREAVVWPSGRG